MAVWGAGPGGAPVCPGPQDGAGGRRKSYVSEGGRLDGKVYRGRARLTFCGDTLGLAMATTGLAESLGWSDKASGNPVCWGRLMDDMLPYGVDGGPGCPLLFGPAGGQAAGPEADPEAAGPAPAAPGGGVPTLRSRLREELLDWLGFWEARQRRDRTILVVKALP